MHLFLFCLFGLLVSSGTSRPICDMTLIAGIVSRDHERPLSRAARDRIREAISRNSGDRPSVYEDEHSFLAKLDTGAFGGPGEVADTTGAITLIAGEPLLGPNGSRGRAADTADIHDWLLTGNTAGLTRANGVFCGIHYRPETGELSLIADKLALRPLYYYISEDLVIFAGALRILEAIAEVPKVMDVRAVTEMVGLGYPLADRTPYIDIKAIRAAEIVQITPDKVSTERYFRWDDIPLREIGESELLDELSHRFETAVARRIGSDTATLAYLSGGLDSRCIVASLRGQNVAVHSFNFARRGTQDQIFGHDFAAAIGAIYNEVPKPAGDLVPDYSALLAKAWKASERRTGPTPERPNLAWSGEGGSVGLGHVHLTEKIAQLMRQGRVDQAIDEHLRREFAQVSPRLFRKEVSDSMLQIIRDGIRDELASLGHADPARSFYIHLLVNDQHRKLARHFENIDLHGIEFQLPLFDSSLLELIVSAPLDDCLRHKLYVKWLSRFPRAVSSVPWQAYPGHEPCPLTTAGHLEYQWSKDYQRAEQRATKERVMSQAKDLLNGGPFPIRLLDRTTLRLAAWAHRTGLRDYGYLIGPAHTYYDYVKKCNGRYAMP